MKRKKMLIINIFLIGVLLFAKFYLYGYYLSSETCMEESAKALYVPKGESKYCLNYKNEKRYLYVSEEEDIWSVLGVQRVGFLYTVSSSYTHDEINKEKDFDIIFHHNSKNGSFIFVVRNNPEIKYIEIIDDSTYVMDEWNDKYTGIMIKSEKAIGDEAIAYNESGEEIARVDMW